MYYKSSICFVACAGAQRWGRWFESSHPDHLIVERSLMLKNNRLLSFFYGIR